MGIARHMDIAGIAGLAMLCAMGGATLEKTERGPWRYRGFCGPPHPTTRQQRRALMRKARDATARC